MRKLVMLLALLIAVTFMVSLAGSDQGPQRSGVAATMLTFTGTVMAHVPGKSIEMAAADGERRTFRLDGASTVSHVDAAVAVGKGAQVVESTSSDGGRTISVKPAPAPPRTPPHVHPNHS
jgi:hypothetical protein